MLARSRQGVNQLIPAQRVPHCALHFDNATSWQNGDSFEQCLFAYRSKVIAIDGAEFGHSIGGGQWNLDFYVSNSSRNFSCQKLIQE